MTLRVLNRAIVHDLRRQRILLVKNKNTRFWYLPGGEWEHGSETPDAGAAREVLEEAGLRICTLRLFYVRTFQPILGLIQLELLWLARPRTVRIPRGHTDRHGLVEEARWFHRSELPGLTVFPTRLKKQFWRDVKNWQHNPYLNE